MTNDQLSELAAAIATDYRANRKRLAQLCTLLKRLAAGAHDAETKRRAEQLAGRRNHAGELVRPEIALPTDPEDLLELRRQLMLAAL